MIAKNAVLGVELSGHIFLQALGSRDDPLYVALMLYRHLARNKLALSQLIAELPAIVMTPDIRVAMGTGVIEKVIDTCRQGMAGALVETVDGVRLVWENGWILVRRSITEPKLTIRIEGETQSDILALANRFIEAFPNLTIPVKSAIDGIIIT